MQEKRTIQLSDKLLEYTLDRGKRKNTYLCISNGELLVKTSMRFPLKSIEKIILEKQNWVFEKLSVTNKTTKEIKYENGEVISILGQPYILGIIHNAKKNSAAICGDKFIVYISKGEVKTITEKYLLVVFASEIKESFDKIQKLIGLTANSVTIKKLNKSWGRCSSKGDISISKKLVFYPKKAIDYVVLHELCHLKHMNHSKDFWGMVERYMPDYKQVKLLLK